MNERKVIFLNQSAFTAFLQCRRKFYYRHIVGIVPKTPIIYPAQAIGLETHRYLQGFDAEQFITDFTATQGKAPTEIQVAIANENFYASIKPSARATAKHIQKVFSYKPHKTEQTGIKAMPKKEYCGYQWFIHGRYDGLEKKEDKEYIADIKTSAEIQEAEDWIIFEKRKKIEAQPFFYQYIFEKPIQYYCIVQPKLRQKNDEGENEFEKRVSDFFDGLPFATHQFCVDKDKETIEEKLLEIQNELMTAIKFNAWGLNYTQCKNWGGMCEFCHACFNEDFEPYEKTSSRIVLQENAPKESIENTPVVDSNNSKIRLGGTELKKMVCEKIKKIFVNAVNLKMIEPTEAYDFDEGVEHDFGKQNNQFILNLSRNTGLQKKVIIKKILGVK